VRPVGCTAKFSEKPLETAYGRKMNIQFTGPANIQQLRTAIEKDGWIVLTKE